MLRTATERSGSNIIRGGWDLNITDGEALIVLSLPSRKVEYVSTTIARITGWSPAEFTRNIVVLTAHGFQLARPKHEEAWAKIYEGVTHVEYEAPTITKCGNLKWIHEQLARVDDETVISIARDVSRRHQWGGMTFYGDKSILEGITP